MNMLKHQSAKNKVKELLEERGFAPFEVQISKSSIMFLNGFVNRELEDMINKAVDYIISYNEKHSSNKLKRITPNLLKNAIFTDLTPELLKTLLSGYEKPHEVVVSKNKGTLSYINSKNINKKTEMVDNGNKNKRTNEILSEIGLRG